MSSSGVILSSSSAMFKTFLYQLGSAFFQCWQDNTKSIFETGIWIQKESIVFNQTTNLIFGNRGRGGLDLRQGKSVSGAIENKFGLSLQFGHLPCIHNLASAEVCVVGSKLIGFKK